MSRQWSKREQPSPLWPMKAPDAALEAVLAVKMHYVEPEDRTPLGFRCLLD